MSASTELRLAPPEDALAVIRRLNGAGHEAWLVGGCVRDGLLGREPQDWDICTDALPADMQRIFAGWHVVETGLKHGTLTVMLNHRPYEVTTYRIDGDYSDHRHPDSVSFTANVADDLRRRDFTVNAMAWHPERGLLDRFGGREDLRDGVIRCVGEPRERFGEDALRILRGLRFAACYGFAIAEDTAAAMRAMAGDVALVAGERIRVEAEKLICGPEAGAILMDFADVITAVFPDLRPMVGFEQHSPWHRFDVWEHCVRAVGAVAPEPLLRWVMLLHDAGKPAAFTLDESGVGHAHGHQRISAEIAAGLFGRMHFDTRTRDRALLLIENHDIDMRPEPRLLTRQLNRYGEEALRQLIAVHCADAKARGVPGGPDPDEWAARMTKALDALLASGPCFTLDRLAVKGADLIAAGIRPGRQMGELLQRLLDAVMDGRAENSREALLRLALDKHDGDPGPERQEE